MGVTESLLSVCLRIQRPLPSAHMKSSQLRKLIEVMDLIKVCFLAFTTSLLVAVLFWYRFQEMFSVTLGRRVSTSAVALNLYHGGSLLESNYGYVLATHFSDQMTGSMANVMSLQCWASTLPGNVRLVEPFIHYQTVLGFSLNTFQHNDTSTRLTAAESSENKVKLSDVFDKKQWSKYLFFKNIPPFVSWDYFIRNAPRQLIVVDQSKTALTDKGLAAFYDSDNFVRWAEEFANHYKFHLVRRVYYEQKTYSQKKFQDLIYGHYKPQETVVIFNHFGGTEKYGDVYRIRAVLQKCSRRNFLYLELRSSSLLRSMAVTYVEKYMKTASEGKSYVAVMIRLEHILRYKRFQDRSKNEQHSMLKKLLDNVVEKVNTVRKKKLISNVFVSLDVGKYGSKSLEFEVSKNDVLKGEIKRLYINLLNGAVTEREMTRRIEETVKVPVSGFVAQLEKNIAAGAACLVLVGGGSYQETISKLYTLFSKEKKQEQCLTKIL